MSNNVNPTKEIGGEQVSITSDRDLRSLLCDVIDQLKIMNLQLSIITDDEINKGDIR